MEGKKQLDCGIMNVFVHTSTHEEGERGRADSISDEIFISLYWEAA